MLSRAAFFPDMELYRGSWQRARLKGRCKLLKQLAKVVTIRFASQFSDRDAAVGLQPVPFGILSLSVSNCSVRVVWLVADRSQSYGP